MNPTALSNALLYGIPVVLYAGMYSGFDSILASRGRCPEVRIRRARQRRATQSQSPEMRMLRCTSRSPNPLSSSQRQQISFGNVTRGAATTLINQPRRPPAHRPTARRRRLHSLSPLARRRLGPSRWVSMARKGCAQRPRMAKLSISFASGVIPYANSRAWRWRSTLTPKQCSPRFSVWPMPWDVRFMA